MKKIIRITTVAFSFNSLLKGQLDYMKQFFDITAVSTGKEGLKILADEEGVKTHEIEMTRKITPIKDLAALFKLYFYFKKEKPDIVHTHTPKAGTLGMIAAKMANVPHRMHTIAGLPLVEARGFKRKVLNFVEKRTYNAATMILPNSYGLKDIILDHKFTNKEKLLIIGNGSSNGINSTHYDSENISEEVRNKLRQEYNIKDDDFVFFFVGRLVSDKGINELVEAFNDISIKNSKCHLILVGPTEPELDPLQKSTESIINNNTKIHHTGYQVDIRPFVAISHALTFPSYREGFPNAVMQAGAMGKPCIVTDINGCNEIIKDNYNGIIIPTKNVDALKEAMNRLLNNPEEVNIMASRARPHIVQNYEQSHVWEQLLNTYHSLN